MLKWQLGLKLPHTVRPFAFDILTNVLLDESFLVGVWVFVDRKYDGDDDAGLHPYLCCWLL